MPIKPRKQRTTTKKSALEPTIDSSFSLKKIQPLTDAQADVFDAFEEGYNLLLCGTAGTGKTFLSLYLCLRDMLNRTDTKGPSKIMIIRSTVSSRDIGFLPGTLKEKMSVYEDPYKGIFAELFGRGDAFEILKTKGVVEFCSTSYLRGTTINNTYIIVDETQNLSFAEIDTTATRIGKNSRVIYCGDWKQNDLTKNRYDVSGLPKFLKIIEKMDEFDIIEFGIDDIVRSALIKSYIIAKEAVENESEDIQT